MDSRIKVETIGYYHRDRNMATTPDIRPKLLNSNRKFFENPALEFPFLKLNIEVPDSAAGEHKMESFLDYISQKGWPNDSKPDFVTNKQLLTYMASGDPPRKIHVFKMGGVIFMTEYHDTSRPRTNVWASSNISEVFKHFFTKTSEDEELENDGSVRKAVLRATVPNREGGGYSVLCSGAVSAIDERGHHYGFKALNRGLCQYFINRRSCYSYWKNILGNISIEIIGTKGTDESKEDVYIRKVDKIHVAHYYTRLQRMSKISMNWTIRDGETELQKFLELLGNTVTKDGDCFVFSKEHDNPDWATSKDSEAVAEFRDVVVQNFPNA